MAKDKVPQKFGIQADVFEASQEGLPEPAYAKTAYGRGRPPKIAFEKEERRIAPIRRWLIIDRERAKRALQGDEYIVRLMDINSFEPKSIKLRFLESADPEMMFRAEQEVKEMV